MDQLKTTTISYGNGIYAIDQEMVRAFLIVGTEQALLLDAGAAPTDILHRIGEITSLPVTVVLTHSDGDHLANLPAFPEAWVAEADHAAVQSFRDCGGVRLHPLTDGQVFDLGGRTLKVIFTPGHTPGSVCLLDEKNLLLFSGDTVSYGAVYMFGPKRNMENYLRSLEMLRNMKDRGVFDTVYCCHNTCPISADTVEDLIACVREIRNGSLRGEPVSMHGVTPLLAKYGKCGILYFEQ